MLHGGDIYGVSKQLGIDQNQCIDFSANINPLGTPQSVITAMKQAIDLSIHYPDPLCRELTKKIAKAENVSCEHILCGNGAADLIYRLVYATKPKKALLLSPTFLEYEEALSQVGTQIEYYSLGEQYQLDYGILDTINQSVNMIFICNPNNPTGILTDLKLILLILKKAREAGSYLVMDECFLDFVLQKKDYSLTSYMNEYDKLIILKSFTKMYSVPGVRLGFMMAYNKELIEKVRLAGQSWSVSNIAQEAGIAALGEEEFIKQTIIYVTDEREYLKRELENMGFVVFQGSANYLFIYEEKIENLYEQLLEKCIIIRRCSNYKGLTSHHYRISVRNHKDNEFLIDTLKSIIKVRE